MKYLFLTALLLLIGGCATAYQRDGLTGGYSDLQLAEDVFQVTFDGNRYTRSQKAADFTLLRCAELAIEHGYTHFIVIDTKQTSRRSSYTTPQTTSTRATVNSYGHTATGTAKSTTTGGHTYVISKPSTTNTIVCFKEEPEEYPVAYEAELVAKSIREKHGISQRGSESYYNW